MQRITVSTLAATLILTGATLGFAGGESCQKTAQAKLAKSSERCAKSTEECLSAMATRIQARGWLGIDTEKTDDGRYQIVSVEHYSPAQEAGFRKGDVLVALNGVSLSTAEKHELKKIKSSLGVGSRVSYTVERGGNEEVLDATLAEVPAPVMAQWIGEHMIDQHAHIEVASR